MSTSTVETIVTGYATDLSTVLTDNLPLVVGILAALVGLGMIIRYFRRWVGRK